MKKVMISLLLVLCGATIAQAGSHGSSVVPAIRMYYHSAYNYTDNQIYLSNITDQEVTVEVNYYNHAGVDVSSVADIYTGNPNGSSQVLEHQNTNTFKIPANSTRFIRFHDKKPQFNIGYGVVKWSTESDKIAKALIGGVRSYGARSADHFHESMTLINNGQPF